MKHFLSLRHSRLDLCLTAFLALVVVTPSHAAQSNTLTATEKAEGWHLLFDGATTHGWHAFKKATFPDKSWAVENGWLVKQPNVSGGDIITDETFTDFELSWEWKISPKGNNGVKYFITEERNEAVGHEYQMMDDIGDTGKHSTASFYDVLPPAKDKPMKPAGEINFSRVLVRGKHVEHWLNGSKVLEYELGSPIVLAGVAASKFSNVKGFGTKLEGHILLTDHHDQAWFRNIKIRRL